MFQKIEKDVRSDDEDDEVEEEERRKAEREKERELLMNGKLKEAGIGKINGSPEHSGTNGIAPEGHESYAGAVIEGKKER